MLVEFGNPAPTSTPDTPVVTYVSVPDEGYGYEPHESAEVLAGKLARHLATSSGVTRVGDISDGTGDHEAFLSVVACWRAESAASTPGWVWSDNDDFAVLLAAFYGCPVGRPDDVEATHYTYAGPPGVAPEATE